VPPSTESRLRTNIGALVGLIAVLVFLVILIATTIVEHRDAVEQERRELTFEASEQAQLLNNYFARARSLTQVNARNPAFREFYELPGTRAERIRRGGVVVRETQAALAYLEELFPDSIGEACFIDRGGPENARAVKGVVEPISRLSPDETGAPFFKPTFALRPGQVYQSRPYLSPDTNEWVIANATPVPGTPRPRQAIVHFEVTIESFRKTAAETSDRIDIQVVDSRTGSVILDTRYRQRVGGKLGRPADTRFQGSTVHKHRPGVLPHGHVDLVSVVRGGERRGTFTIDRKNSAFERLERTGENANDWVVVATGRKPSASWLQSLGFFEVGAITGLFVLLGLAVASLRFTQSELRSAALTDPLTGLGNRRQLTLDLERKIAASSAGDPLLLLLFDLDGFKSYNDMFGHPAGDALLARLGKGLQNAVSSRGAAYRMGGDEFCVIARAGKRENELWVKRVATGALTEHGEGFEITAACGSVLIPGEGRTPSEALRLADQRMYASKASGRKSASRQTMDVLVRVLSERNTELGEHIHGVAELAGLVARKLGFPEEAIGDVERAGRLHDIGKIAIPDAILEKRGALDEAEWTFIRRHTLVGERIVGAAPSLAHVAKIVRSSHEWFDGSGYPDGLAGEQIPLSARIISVCDAFGAMTSDRPYRPAMSIELACAELRAHAGTQFDPTVVDAFLAILTKHRSENRPRRARELDYHRYG
jgi:diguanylate cyclase (GGDEF)-like protein